MSMNLKDAENRIKKYLKPAKLQRDHLIAKIDYFFGARFALQWGSLLHLLKSSELRPIIFGILLTTMYPG